MTLDDLPDIAAIPRPAVCSLPLVWMGPLGFAFATQIMARAVPHRDSAYLYAVGAGFGLPPGSGVRVPAGELREIEVESAWACSACWSEYLGVAWPAAFAVPRGSACIVRGAND